MSLSQRAATCMIDANEGVQQLFSQLQNSNRSTDKSECLTENVRVFSNPSVQHMLAIEELLCLRVSKCSYYNWFIVKGILCHSEVNQLQKRNNSIVELRNGMLYKIRSLVAFKPHNVHMTIHLHVHVLCAVCWLVNLSIQEGYCADSQFNISSTFVHYISESDNIIAVHAHHFKIKCELKKQRVCYSYSKQFGQRLRKC